MAEKTNKSHFTQKQPEKEEKPSEDDLKLRKLEKIIKKLQTAGEHKEKYERNTHNELSKQKVNNKSNYSSPTTSRIKEDISDREFLINCMNIDEHYNILPKNMHLLTDNDTNQSISSQEKFKNLSNLMLDDKNITEFNFIRNSEERVKLNLYTAFSKKSRELFMNENHPKRSKNQILFHKINDIHIPKFEFKPTISTTNNENKSGINSSYNEASEGEKSCGSENNNVLLLKENLVIPEEQRKEKEKEEKKFTECYFRQEKKGYFRIPSLVKIDNTVKTSAQKKEFRKQKTYIGGTTKLINPFKKEVKKQDDIFWDPEIDADTLSYINHNFISIEDIYNGCNIEEKNDKNKNPQIQNDEESNLVPIQAKEYFFDKDNKAMNNFVYEKDKKIPGYEQMDVDKMKVENRNHNRFIEFIAISPGVIHSEYQVSQNAKEDLKFGLDLKKDFKEKINKISEIDLNLFPRNGSLNAKKIERTLRFQQLVKESKEIEFSLGVKLSTSDESELTIKELNDDDKIKIGKINNFQQGINLKDKSFSEIDEKRSLIYEDDEYEESHKNINSLNSQSNNLDSGKNKKVFNFIEGNSEHSPFSSEKS